MNKNTGCSFGVALTRRSLPYRASLVGLLFLGFE